MVRDGVPETSSIYSEGNRIEEGDRFDLEISGDLINWERVGLLSAMLTETGALSLSEHVFAQRKPILKTDGINQVFVGRIPEVIVAGTLSITDGTYTWSQTEGSSAPDDFSVTFAPATRSVVVAYPSSIPDVNKEIRAVYDVEVRHSLATFVRLNGNSPQVPEGFALIPGGNFTMGVTSGDTDENAPPVDVYVSEFYMATHEVTKALWDEVLNWANINGYSGIYLARGKAPDHPVHSVRWLSAVKWCNARSEMEGLTPVYIYNGEVNRNAKFPGTPNWNANGYRLPTEAEWEKAARGGMDGQRFPWGDTITHDQANYKSSSSFSYDISSTRGYHPTYNDITTPYLQPGDTITAPVGSFPPNGYGVYDMAGNVAEWCWDRYSASTYTDGAKDPSGPSTGTDRVMRGGGWFDSAARCRAADRYRLMADSYSTAGGFRVVRSFVP